jgi:hypothetical protein
LSEFHSFAISGRYFLIKVPGGYQFFDLYGRRPALGLWDDGDTAFESVAPHRGASQTAKLLREVEHFRGTLKRGRFSRNWINVLSLAGILWII